MKNSLSLFSLLRVLAIVCIVMHHSITAFGGWPPHSPIVQELPGFFWRICGVSKDIGLFLFVFLSGWFAESSWVHSGQKVLPFVLKKSNRLLIPCVVAGIIYWILFPHYMFGCFPDPINGTHLWYLPMIFSCFVLVPLLSRVRKRLVLASVFAIVSWILIDVSLKFIPGRTIVELNRYWPIFSFAYILGSIDPVRKSLSSMNNVTFLNTLSWGGGGAFFD